MENPTYLHEFRSYAPTNYTQITAGHAATNFNKETLRLL
jgi:hypothetical protein